MNITSNIPYISSKLIVNNKNNFIITIIEDVQNLSNRILPNLVSYNQETQEEIFYQLDKNIKNIRSSKSW